MNWNEISPRAETDLEYHQQIMGRVIAFLVQKGFARIDLDPSDAFEIMVETRGDEEDALKTFFDILHWMHEEGLIRVKSIQPVTEHSEVFNGVQATSKAIALFKRPQEILDNQSIEKKVTENKSKLDSDTYSKIAEAAGSFLGGLGKSLAGGG